MKSYYFESFNLKQLHSETGDWRVLSLATSTCHQSGHLIGVHHEPEKRNWFEWRSSRCFIIYFDERYLIWRLWFVLRFELLGESIRFHLLDSNLPLITGPLINRYPSSLSRVWVRSLKTKCSNSPFSDKIGGSKSESSIFFFQNFWKDSNQCLRTIRIWRLAICSGIRVSESDRWHRVEGI